jgi:thioredoxin 1
MSCHITMTNVPPRRSWHLFFLFPQTEIMAGFSELINGDQPVLVDFFAEWCGPCKTLAPILTDVSRQMEGKARIIKVDIDRNPQAASHFGIRSVPTLMVFRNGEIKWKQSGVVPASELVSILRQYS